MFGRFENCSPQYPKINFLLFSYNEIFDFLAIMKNDMVGTKFANSNWISKKVCSDNNFFCSLECNKNCNIIFIE